MEEKSESQRKFQWSRSQCGGEKGTKFNNKAFALYQIAINLLF